MDPLYVRCREKACAHTDQALYWMGRSCDARRRGWVFLAQKAAEIAEQHAKAATAILREFRVDRTGTSQEAAKA